MSVGAIIIRKERQVVERFREAGAVGPGSARPLAALNVDEGLALRRLRRTEVIREAPGGGFYLDEPSWTARQGTRRRVMLALLLLGAVAGAAVYLASRGR